MNSLVFTLASPRPSLCWFFASKEAKTRQDALLSKPQDISPRKLSFLSAGAFVYAGLFSTEGIGLLLRKRLGEYFTIIITGSFLPFEIYELVAKEFNPFKLVLLLGNAAVLVYLIWHLKQAKKKG